MKKCIILISIILISAIGYGQNVTVASYDSTDGRPGEKFIIKPQYLTHPLIAINDSTSGMDTGRYYISSYVLNGTADSSVLTLKDGTRWAVKSGASGPGGGSPAGSTYDIQTNIGGVFGAAHNKLYYDSTLHSDTGTNYVTNTATIFRGSSSASAGTAIELRNTSGTGKMWILRSLSSGKFDFNVWPNYPSATGAITPISADATGSVTFSGTIQSGGNLYNLSNTSFGSTIALTLASNTSTATNYSIAGNGAYTLLNAPTTILYFRNAGANSGAFQTSRNFTVGTVTDIANATFQLQGRQGINITAMDTSASLQIDALGGKTGILIPRMTTAWKKSMVSGIRTGSTSAGSGYTPGVYTNIALTGGTGAGAIATITVNAGGNASITTITFPGYEYKAGDVLSATGFGAGSGYTYNVVTVQQATKTLQVADTSQNQISKLNPDSTWSDFNLSTATALTLRYANDYVFTGTTAATYTLPVIASNILGRQNAIWIKNRGTATITLNSASGSTIYTNAAVSTLSIIAGDAIVLLPDGSYFNAMFNNAIL